MTDKSQRDLSEQKDRRPATSRTPKTYREIPQGFSLVMK